MNFSSVLWQIAPSKEKLEHMSKSVVNETLLKKQDLLHKLFTKLQLLSSYEQKNQVLDTFIASFFKMPSFLYSFISGLSSECEYVLKSFIALDEQERIKKCSAKQITFLRLFIQDLLVVEEFYAQIGGILGYHLTIVKLLISAKEKKALPENFTYFSPEGIDISESKNPMVRQWILEGIRCLDKQALLLPIGGAADRLGLQDKLTGAVLPAAKLKFVGKTLLEHLISDIQAYEYLHYKLFNKNIAIPIALMSSKEKNNYQHIQNIFKKKNWFGRAKDSFYFFLQPMIPTVCEEGNWVMQTPLQLLQKPGGHGVIWKLAKEKGVLDWFKKKNRLKILVRQINNPISGIDFSMLAFLGYGHMQDMHFGFSSCESAPNMAEGKNVFIEEKIKGGYQYRISNIEYCHFDTLDEEILDAFYCNTNILFADLLEIEKAIKKMPFPGMLLNLKEVSYLDENKKRHTKKIARLESTMQNISDAFVEKTSFRKEDQKLKHCFLTLSPRRKTISTIKKSFSPKSPLETPRSCFYDLLKNHEQLLLDHCHATLFPLGSYEEFLQKGPSFIFSYHPSLGPLYSIIAQKLSHLSFAKGSKLKLDIAEVDIQKLTLVGTAEIRAMNIMGHIDENGLLKYSCKTGCCSLQNVTIENQGIDWKRSRSLWKDDLHYHEKFSLVLHGHSSFYAKDVTFKGNVHVEVEDGYAMYVTQQKDGSLKITKKKITKPTCLWEYMVDEKDEIRLKRTKDG